MVGIETGFECGQSADRIDVAPEWSSGRCCEYGHSIVTRIMTPSAKYFYKNHFVLVRPLRRKQMLDKHADVQ